LKSLWWKTNNTHSNHNLTLMCVCVCVQVCVRSHMHGNSVSHEQVEWNDCIATCVSPHNLLLF
jgi:hypothetical protein